MKPILLPWLFLFGITALHAEPDIKLTVGEVELRKHLPAETYELTTLRLWPKKAPDEPRPIPAEAVTKGNRSMRITNVTEPSITIARPVTLTAPSPAVLVCPGGGYGLLGVSSGGTDVINWLKDLGIVGVYLKYRVPKRHQGYAIHHHPLQDIQRAMKLLRSQAKTFNIDPTRIGVIGFSAGGNLASLAATNFRPKDQLYKPIDKVDTLSSRPDFVMLVAPAYLTKPIVSDQLMPELKLDHIRRNHTPPFFICSATTDKFTVGALHFALALRERKIPTEIHSYEKGGHAETIHDKPDNQWWLMAEDWLRRKAFLTEAEPKP